MSKSWMSSFHLLVNAGAIGGKNATGNCFELYGNFVPVIAALIDLDYERLWANVGESCFDIF